MNGIQQPAVVLLQLTRQARLAATPAELQFQLVNDTQALVPYRQAILWFRPGVISCLSGVVQVEANTPYVQWASTCIAKMLESGSETRCLTAADLPEDIAARWGDWLPSHACWIPFNAGSHPDEGKQDGLLLARDLPFEKQELRLLEERVENWNMAWLLKNPRRKWSILRSRRKKGSEEEQVYGSKARRGLLALAFIALIALSALPVPLTVLAPAELVPSQPVLIRSPIDGVIERFEVQPNDSVVEGQKLFQFDKIILESRLEVAEQVLQTAQVEHRQLQQLALQDPRVKSQLALTLGKIEEKRREVHHLSEQIKRAMVQAPQSGVVLFSDPSEWAGKHVIVGESIMRIARLDDKEIEAWIPISDAIPLSAGTRLSFHLNASPLSPIEAEVRYFAHDASKRPDGSYAYRLRARLLNASVHRIGLKGTAKLYGEDVPLLYWVMRRPLATARVFLGI